MARVLHRPMFRRGGNVTNPDTGIVAGFKHGGTVPKRGLVDGPGGYAGEEPPEQSNYADILASYMQEPVKPSGLTQSDYLRIAAAGAEIMGAPPSGRSGALGALQSASPALSSLGVDLATASDARRSDYLNRKGVYDSAMASAAIQSESDKMAFARERFMQDDTQQAQSELQDDAQQFELDLFEKTVTFENDKLQTEYDNAVNLLKEEAKLKPYDFEVQYILEEGQKIIEEMANLDEDSEEYKNLKNKLLNGLYGESTRAASTEKATLLRDKDFLTAVEDLAGAIEESGELTDPNSPYYDMTYSQVYDAMLKKMFSEIVVDVYIPQGLKDGGRVGLNYGGTPEDEYMRRYKEKELEGGQFPEPGDDPYSDEMPVAESQNIDLSFAELRQRLPAEVSDQVIKLIMSSEEAMVDFAKIQTPQDVQVFNKKYNSDLQMPTQVA